MEKEKKDSSDKKVRRGKDKASKKGSGAAAKDGDSSSSNSGDEALEAEMTRDGMKALRGIVALRRRLRKKVIITFPSLFRQTVKTHRI